MFQHVCLLSDLNDISQIKQKVGKSNKFFVESLKTFKPCILKGSGVTTCFSFSSHFSHTILLVEFYLFPRFKKRVSFVYDFGCV